jgi:hypothetical protein
LCILFCLIVICLIIKRISHLSQFEIKQTQPQVIHMKNEPSPSHTRLRNEQISTLMNKSYISTEIEWPRHSCTLHNTSLCDVAVRWTLIIYLLQFRLFSSIFHISSPHTPLSTRLPNGRRKKTSYVCVLKHSCVLL